MADLGPKNTIGGVAGIGDNGLIQSMVLPIDNVSITTVDQASTDVILSQVGSSISSPNPTGAATFYLSNTGLSYSVVIDNIAATLNLYQNNSNTSPLLIQSGISITDGVTPSTSPFQIVVQVLDTANAFISVSDSNTQLIYSFKCTDGVITTPGTSVNIGIAALGLSAANLGGFFFIFASGASSGNIYQLQFISNSYTLYDTIIVGDIIIDCTVYQQSDSNYYLSALSTDGSTTSTVTQYEWNSLNFVSPISTPISPITLDGTINAILASDNNTYLSLIIPENNFIAFFQAVGNTLTPITAFDVTPYGTLPPQKALYPTYSLNSDIYTDIPLINNGNIYLTTFYFNGSLYSKVGNTINVGNSSSDSIYNILAYEIDSLQFLFTTDNAALLISNYQATAQVTSVLQGVGGTPFYNAIPYNLNVNNTQQYRGQINTSISTLAALTAQQVALTWGIPFDNAVIGLPDISIMESTANISISYKIITVDINSIIVEVKNLDAVNATGTITITAKAVGY